MFIALEGPDGAGSSTQAQLLADRLKKEGYPVFLTKEPTPKPPIGTLIRSILQHEHEVSPQALQLLFCADRAEHLAKEVEPALERGEWVISDRYVLSTLAYGSLHLPLEGLEKLNASFRFADLTLLFELPVEVCLERIQNRGAKIELFETRERLSRIQLNYRNLAQKYPHVESINAQEGIKEVHEAVWKKVKALRK